MCKRFDTRPEENRFTTDVCFHSIQQIYTKSIRRQNVEKLFAFTSYYSRLVLCLLLFWVFFMYCLDSNRNFVKSKQKNKINRYKTCLDCSTVYKFITCSGHTKLMITSFYFVLNFFCRSFDLKKSRFYFIYFLSEKIIFESICSEIVSKFKWKKY